MEQPFVTSDTHFGHQLLANGEFRPWTTVDEMNDAMIERWNAIVPVKARVYHLGDVVMNRKYLHIMHKLHGRKVLIKGNHDIFPLKDYVKYFDDIRAYHKLGGVWLSHIPLHPNHRPGKVEINVHGHLHQNLVLQADGTPDPRYINVCVEHTNYTPLPWEEVERRIRACST